MIVADVDAINLMVDIGNVCFMLLSCYRVVVDVVCERAVCDDDCDGEDDTWYMLLVVLVCGIDAILYDGSLDVTGSIFVM